MTKSLDITDVKEAKANISDIKVYGDGDTFKLICKASSEEQGWMKSTKAMEVEGVGCVIQITTQQRNFDGSYAIAEALSYIPNVKIEEDAETGISRIVQIV